MVSPQETFWVYDLCEEFPTWNEKKQDYVFKKEPKRISPQRAKQIIKEEGLKCVCTNEYGRTYA